MPACTTVQILRVVGAGQHTSTTGLYYPNPGLVNNFSSYSYFNGLSTYPRVEVYTVSGSDTAWGIFTAANIPVYRSRQLSGPGQNPNTALPNCPNNLTWVYGSATNTGAVPTVVEKTTTQIHVEYINTLYGNQSINGFFLEDGSIGTSKMTNGAVTTAKIADSNVTTAKIADSNVTTAKIADSAVTTAKIADSAVTTAKIADGNVTTAKIADGNVTTVKIADSNVTTAKIADGAITASKLNSAVRFPMSIRWSVDPQYLPAISKEGSYPSDVEVSREGTGHFRITHPSITNASQWTAIPVVQRNSQTSAIRIAYPLYNIGSAFIDIYICTSAGVLTDSGYFSVSVILQQFA
jgi:hypothetical protein